eukprot:1168461-Rhodomonas_salina.1
MGDDALFEKGRGCCQWLGLGEGQEGELCLNECSEGGVVGACLFCVLCGGVPSMSMASSDG